MTRTRDVLVRLAVSGALLLGVLVIPANDAAADGFEVTTTSTTISVSWSAMSRAEAYQVHYRGLGWRDDRGRIPKGFVETSDTSVTLRDMEPGRKYDVSVWVKYVGDRNWRERHWRVVTTGADAPVTPSVTVVGGSGVGEGSPASFTVSASPAPSSPLSVSLLVGQSGDFAASGATGSKSVTVPTSGSATYSVATVDDSVDEADGSVTVALVGGSGYTVGAPGSASVSVSDNDDPPPTPSVTVTSGAGVAEGGVASFTVSATPAPKSALSVSLTVSQSGDYAASGATGSKSVIVPTTGSVTYTVATVDDAADEADGSVTVALVGGSGYTVGAPGSASVSVSDNDDPPPTPSVTVTSGAGVAEGGVASFTVSATPAPKSALSVSLSVSQSGDFAAAGATGSKSVIVPTTGSVTYTVATVDDAADEADGSVTVALASGNGYTLGAPASASVVVSDDDDPPLVTPSVTVVGGSAVGEGSAASFTVSATPAPKSPLAVSLTVSQSGDFVVSGATGSKSVTVPTSGSVTYSVATVDDSVDEADGSVTVALASGNGYALGAPASASVSVSDNDDPPPDTPETKDTPVPEKKTAVVCKTTDSTLMAQVEAKVTRHATSGRTDLLEMFTSVRNTMKGEGAYTVSDLRSRPDKQHANWARPGPNALWQAVYTELDRLEACRDAAEVEPEPANTTPQVSITAGAGVTEGGAASFTVTASPAPTSALTVSLTVSQSGDFAASGTTGTKSVTVPTTGTVTYTVATVDDAADEADGSVTVALASGNGYDIGTPASASVSVSDNDDPPPTPSITVTADGGVTEGGAASFTVAASPAPTSPLTVSLTVSQSGDFAASGTTGTKSVTVPTTGTVTYTVATVDDAADEADGSVTVALASGNGYDIGTPSTAAVTVADNDGPITVKIEAVTTGPITEGQSATFRVTASRAPASTLAVKIDIQRGAEFLSSSAARTVAIPANQTTAVISIQTDDDNVHEVDGPLTVKVWAMQSYQAGSPMMATVQVEDNDPKPTTVSVATVTGTVSEGQAAQFTLTSDPVPTVDVMVKIDLIERGGYIASTDPITVVIPKGQATKTFAIPTLDDHEVEDSGTVTAKVWAMKGVYEAGDPMMATVTVQDDDNLKIRMVAGPAVREGEAASVTLIATPPPLSPVAVTYSVAESGSGDRVSAGDEGTHSTSVSVGGSVVVSVPTSAPAGQQGVGTVTFTITSVTGSGYGIGSPASATVQVGDPVDYDVDDDGLIDISSLAQLDAIRWDTDGNGVPDTYAPSGNRHMPSTTWTDHERIVLYAAAYPFAVDGMGCPSTGCKGFELKQHLDFDTNGDGRVDQAGDDYWNDGKGWLPIAGVLTRNDHEFDCVWIPVFGPGHWHSCGSPLPAWPYAFSGVFEGNGYEIRNLYVNDARLFGAGLFAISRFGSTIRNLGLTVTAGSGSQVRGYRMVGALVGYMSGTVSAVYSNVDVYGRQRLGGLIGTTSWKVDRLIESYATGNVTGTAGYNSWAVGGLVGWLNGTHSLLAASFATGTVTAVTGDHGGLVGDKWGHTHIRAVYATGDVNNTKDNGFSGYTRSGGLMGDVRSMSWGSRLTFPVKASYSTGSVGIDGRSGVYGGSMARCKGHDAPHFHDVYWDITSSGRSTSACGEGFTTTQLQAPTGYDTAQTIDGSEAKIYEDWNIDVDFDSDSAADDPWDFGTASQYPILKYCADKGDIENTAVLKTYSDKTGKEYCPLREVLQHGRKPNVTP